jgi:hypothetical protein
MIASFKGIVSLHMSLLATDNGPLTTDPFAEFSGKDASSTNNRNGRRMFHPLFPSSHLPITLRPMTSCSSVPASRLKEITRGLIPLDSHRLKTPALASH